MSAMVRNPVLRLEQALNLTAWMAEHGLLVYYDHCTRPDGTDGPAWVVRNPAMVDGSSCEAWHATSAALAVDAWLAGAP